MTRLHFAGVFGVGLVLAMATVDLTAYAHAHHRQVLHAAMVVGVVFAWILVIIGVVGLIAPRATATLLRRVRHPRQPGVQTGWWVFEIVACILFGGVFGGLIGLEVQGETFLSGFVLGCIVIGPVFLLIDVVKGRREGKPPWDV
jgi:hypothetical protein